MSHYVKCCVAIFGLTSLTSCLFRQPIETMGFIFVNLNQQVNACRILTVEFPSRTSSVIYRGETSSEAPSTFAAIAFGSYSPPITSEEKARDELFQFTVTCTSDTGVRVQVTKPYQFIYQESVTLDIGEFK
jgi:hypothetical protein